MKFRYAFMVLSRCADDMTLKRYHYLPQAVAAGLTPMTRVRSAVTRLMLLRMRLGMFDPQSDVPFAAPPLSVRDGSCVRLRARARVCVRARACARACVCVCTRARVLVH